MYETSCCAAVGLLILCSFYQTVLQQLAAPSSTLITQVAEALLKFYLRGIGLVVK